MEGMSVKITSTESVKPVGAANDHQEKFSLTAFDRIMRHLPYERRVLFYKCPGGSGSEVSFEQVVQLLKGSLAEALKIFFPLAGRIQYVGSDPESGIPYMELDCGAGQSINFTLAETDATLEGLRQQHDGFQPSEFCDLLCDVGSPPPRNPWNHDFPLAFVQLTKFHCGGFSLGFAFSHQAMDGMFAWRFLASWAEITRTGSLQLLPDIRFKLEDSQEKRLAEVRAALQWGDCKIPEELVQIESSPPTGLDVNGEKKKTKLVSRKFDMDKQFIDNLRSEGASASNGTRFSTFVLVVSYLWSVIQKLPDFRNSKITYPINCRERIPSFSKSYFGNAIVNYLVDISYNVRSKEDDQDMWECAAALHESIASFDEDMVLQNVASVDWLYANYERMKLDFPGKLVLVSGSPWQQVYEVDFGLGKPEGMTFATSNLTEGRIFLFPSPKEGAAVEATLVLTEHDMEQLKSFL